MICGLFEGQNWGARAESPCYASSYDCSPGTMTIQPTLNLSVTMP